MKKIITLLLTIIFIMTMIITVEAAEENTILTASATEVKPGEEFTITITGTSTLKVTGISAGLSFDSSKLQLVEKIAGTGFVDMSSENKIEFALTNTSAATTNAKICTLKFKVIETAEVNSKATINLSDLEMAVVTEDSIQQNISLDMTPTATINIAQGQVKDPEVNNNIVKDTNDKTTGSNDNAKKNTTKTDTTKKETSKIAQTGLETTVLFVIAGLSIVSTISYVAYKKYNNV